MWFVEVLRFSWGRVDCVEGCTRIFAVAPALLCKTWREGPLSNVWRGWVSLLDQHDKPPVVVRPDRTCWMRSSSVLSLSFPFPPLFDTSLPSRDTATNRDDHPSPISRISTKRKTWLIPKPNSMLENAQLARSIATSPVIFSPPFRWQSCFPITLLYHFMVNINWIGMKYFSKTKNCNLLHPNIISKPRSSPIRAVQWGDSNCNCYAVRSVEEHFKFTALYTAIRCVHDTCECNPQIEAKFA